MPRAVGNAVVDLERFTETWRRWLEGDDEHSIVNQINTMCYDYAAFRVLAEAAETAERFGQPSAGSNSLLAESLSFGFAARQALAVRRLTDSSRGVISLRRLTNDVTKRRSLFTREAMVRRGGFAYDAAEARRRSDNETLRWFEASPPSTIRYVERPAAGDDWRETERRHNEFDRLTIGRARAPDDRIPRAVFDQLLGRLQCEAIRSLRDFADKRVAHAADEASLTTLANLTTWPTWRLIDAAHRALLYVAEFVASRLLGTTIANPVPIPQFNIFEHLDQSWLPKDNWMAAQERWNAIATEREQWAREAWVIRGA